MNVKKQKIIVASLIILLLIIISSIIIVLLFIKCKEITKKTQQTEPNDILLYEHKDEKFTFRMSPHISTENHISFSIYELAYCENHMQYEVFCGERAIKRKGYKFDVSNYFNLSLQDMEDDYLHVELNCTDYPDALDIPNNYDTRFEYDTWHWIVFNRKVACGTEPVLCKGQEGKQFIIYKIDNCLYMHIVECKTAV